MAWIEWIQKNKDKIKTHYYQYKRHLLVKRKRKDRIELRPPLIRQMSDKRV